MSSQGVNKFPEQRAYLEAALRETSKKAKAFAELIDEHPTTWSRWKNGLREIPPEKRQLIDRIVAGHTATTAPSNGTRPAIARKQIDSQPWRDRVAFREGTSIEMEGEILSKMEPNQIEAFMRGVHAMGFRFPDPRAGPTSGNSSGGK